MLNSLDYGYLIGPRIQIVDADGKPMTGAWLRVFIAGTTTDANTFSDWEGTVQPAKKILDARGETTIIAAVSGAYKIMLCDSTHPVSSPYWYADNVVMAYVNELDVIPIVVDAEVGKLTVTVVTDTLGIKHSVVGIDPAYTAEREAAEAAAKTEVAPGTNVHVDSSTAADGHKVYTVSTGQKKYSLFVNSAGTSNLYAKIATCDPSDALIADYGWINGSFLATEFNGAATIFSMNVERAINGQAYSGDINAFFEGRNLSSFSYANSSNLEEIRLYENITTKAVELWVKLKAGYKDCQTAFAVLENDANNGTPLSTTPWVLAENPTLVSAWPEGLSDRVNLSHSENQVKSLAYLDTQIMPGDNVTVVESTNAYGKHVYTITGSAPNVTVTSTDGSLDITENSTPTSKIIDISVNRSFSDFVGTFSGTLSNNVVINSLVKTSGSMLISGTGVALPAGSYHVDVVCSAGTPTFSTNTTSALIIVNETATGRSFTFSANPKVVEPQMFAFGIDVKLTENKILSISSLTSADGSQEWTLNGTVFIHSINGISSGSSGSDDHLVLAGPSDTTPGTLIEKLAASGMTHLYDRGTSVEINSAPTIDSTLTGTGVTSSPLGLANPTWYTKGNTVYGGTIVTDLNVIAHGGFFTATGSATGVPNSSYSWFVLHQNSNAGTVYAQQTAYAYNSASIICYERVKSASTWGNWILRGSAWPMTTFESGALLAYPGILYVGSSITNFILTLAPSIGGEYHIKFTTSSTIGMINLTSVTSWIGSVPTVEAGKTYELDILDNVGVMAEVS